MLQSAKYTDLPAFKFGHATDAEAATGCTVVVAPEGAVAGVDVRGGGPATRETDLLKPENMIEKIHAVVLSGGSAYGLAAADGVMTVLEERGIGFDAQGITVPIVSGASLFDLTMGTDRRPDGAMGRAATQAAFDEMSFEEGNVGAGTGASTGKLLGPMRACKTGFGRYFVKAGPLVVGALVALNALGNVKDEQGTLIAGCRSGDETIMDSTEALLLALQHATGDSSDAPCTNTTLGVVVTNADITKAQATKISSVTHDAYARSIEPVHTSNDGDTIFTLASGEIPIHSDVVGVLACKAMQQAIVRAVLKATGAHGLPACHGQA